eukprot:3481839-Prymnesium_polylepis.1
MVLLEVPGDIKPFLGLIGGTLPRIEHQCSGRGSKDVPGPLQPRWSSSPTHLHLSFSLKTVRSTVDPSPRGSQRTP